jgi:hypothetical protein
MDEWSANNQDRAKAVWDRLLGYFGDGLLRKFGDEPTQEWVEAIAELNDFQIRRGFKRLRYGWKGGVPNLPDFVRFCIAIGDSAPDEGPSEHIPVPTIEGPQFDGWDISGNMRFWKYVSHRLMDFHRPWGAPGSTQHTEATRIAVAYKNAWAQDMRESQTVDTATGEIIRLSEDEQARQFADCMKRAEDDIVVLLRGKAA